MFPAQFVLSMSHLDQVIINISSALITGDSTSDICDVLQPDGSIKMMSLHEAATNGSVDNDHKKCVQRLGDEWIVRYHDAQFGLGHAHLPCAAFLFLRT